MQFCLITTFYIFLKIIIIENNFVAYYQFLLIKYFAYFDCWFLIINNRRFTIVLFTIFVITIARITNW